MQTSRNCVIGSILVAVIGVAVIVGIYFAVANGGSESNETATTPPPTHPITKLLIKSNDGLIHIFEFQSKKFIETKVDEKFSAITAFAPHLDKTIYYATTEPDSVIQSTNKSEYPDLPLVTAEWIRTAIAVDDVTKNVYVLDRIEKRIKVVNGNYYYTLPLYLMDEPSDLILAPEQGTMFVLQKSQISMTDMDGMNGNTVLEANNIQAMAVDTTNGILYYARPNVISSFDYMNSHKEIKINEEESKVHSLAYKDKVLYFINKKGKSSKLPGTSLDNCRLDDTNCPGKCCNVVSVHKSEQLEQVKIYQTEKPQRNNPCEVEEKDRCQHLCLLNSDEVGRSCACNDGWTIQTDGKTCKQNSRVGLK